MSLMKQLWNKVESETLCFEIVQVIFKVKNIVENGTLACNNSFCVEKFQIKMKKIKHSNDTPSKSLSAIACSNLPASTKFNVSLLSPRRKL